MKTTVDTKLGGIDRITTVADAVESTTLDAATSRHKTQGSQ